MSKRKASDDEAEQKQRDEGPKRQRTRKQLLALIDLPLDVLRQAFVFLSLEDTLFGLRPTSKFMKANLAIQVGHRPMTVFTWSLHLNVERKQMKHEMDLLDFAMDALPNLFHSGEVLDLSGLKSSSSPQQTLRLPVLLQLLSQCHTTLKTLIMPQEPPADGKHQEGRPAFGDATGLRLREITDLVKFGIDKQKAALSQQLEHLEADDKAKSAKPDRSLPNKIAVLQSQLTSQSVFLKAILNTAEGTRKPPQVDATMVLVLAGLMACTKLERLVWSNGSINVSHTLLMTQLWGGHLLSLTELHFTVTNADPELDILFGALSDVPGRQRPLRHLIVGQSYQHRPQPSFPVSEANCTRFGQARAKHLETFVLHGFVWPNATDYMDRHLAACARLRQLIGGCTELRQFGLEFVIGGQERHFETEQALWKEDDSRDTLGKIMFTIVRQNPKLDTLAGLGPFLNHFKAQDLKRNKFSKPEDRKLDVVKAASKFPLFTDAISGHKALRRLLVPLAEMTDRQSITRMMLVNPGQMVQLVHEQAIAHWTTWTTYRPERTITPRPEHKGIMDLPNVEPEAWDGLVRSWPWVYGDYPIDLDLDFRDGFTQEVRRVMNDLVLRPIARISHTSSPWQVFYQHPSLVWDSKAEHMRVTDKIAPGTLLAHETGLWSASTNRLVATFLLHGDPKNLSSTVHTSQHATMTPFFTQWSLKEWNEAIDKIWSHSVVIPRTGQCLLPLLTMRLSIVNGTYEENLRDANVFLIIRGTRVMPFALECFVIAAHEILPNRVLLRRTGASMTVDEELWKKHGDTVAKQLAQHATLRLPPPPRSV